MSMFTLAIFCLTTSIYLDSGSDIPGSYAVVFFTALDFISIMSPICNRALFSLWLSLFILSGAISPVCSNSILGIYHPGEFIFQCHIFLPFHTLHGILKARILKWFSILFSSGPFVRTLHQDFHLGWPYKAWLIVSFFSTFILFTLENYLLTCLNFQLM